MKKLFICSLGKKKEIQGRVSFTIRSDIGSPAQNASGIFATTCDANDMGGALCMKILKADTTGHLS